MNKFILIVVLITMPCYGSEMLEGVGKTTKVKVSELMENFFSDTSCLPSNERLKEKFNRELQRKGKKEIVPPEIKSSLAGKYESEVEFMEDMSLQGMMHLYWFEEEKKKRFLEGSSTYEQLNPMELIFKTAGSFIYSADCSGYTSILANSSLNLGAGELAATAKNSSSSKFIFFAARGKITSPIALTTDPTLRARTSISAEDQAALLWSVLNVMHGANQTSIVVPANVDVLTYSSEGGKTLQGKFDLNGGGGIGFAVGSISTEGSAGIGYSKSLTFSSPKSAILTYGDEKVVKKDDVKFAYVEALRRINFERKPEYENFVIEAKLGQNFCQTAGWIFNFEIDSVKTEAKDISANWLEGAGVCKLEVNTKEIKGKSAPKVFISVKSYGHKVPLIANETAPLVRVWDI